MIHLDILTEIFVDVDDFMIQFSGKPIETAIGEVVKKGPPPNMTLSEMMAIVIGFHFSGYRTFKKYFLALSSMYKGAFPRLLSYSRFIEYFSSLALPLWGFLLSKRGKCTGISYVDSTKIVVCHGKRAKRNKVFEGMAKFGKSSMGWFYGFKLHIIVNEHGELLEVNFTTGNVDDRVPLREIIAEIFGSLFGDKGYISSDLTKYLINKGIQLITPIKKNMKNKLIPYMDKILLRKRAIIETINDQLKNECQIEHSRHRSPKNFVVNLISGLVAYSLKPKKPSLDIDRSLLPVAMIID